ncbi:DUF4032 domain-containing protein [Corynebacterium sp. 153RC1]|uniref:DUF4032 domain-containing protein n=2 Tax=Bacillati TaxID=1783272 RepID=UPI00211C0368|nr:MULTISPECIES: DUF4032 domain-containing protein [unclassified Corynebacterium]MCQ9370102.1 DUF4032 domain-containing protein [Corynebacterium sp. 35RC1]MCQ9351876.1 DUF4032 domain-containing protein [Corynebacterium sp. 209RC1]MCQ9355033.1 DUF4032 domain-containing protein [Corynebacterium sp. 1222RC1]MCQ9356158.1 DUF4032 domain-containing protein [Corynebacterium sp. 122RC1]MCQ9359553.1 DUF4032 domain-containing protein [Corynebacterium sp. 142RC1]
MPASNPSMSIANSTFAYSLLQLPWHLPLVDWPQDLIAALPRGISRHEVRFVRINGHVIAIKEIGQKVAHHEFRMLQQLGRLGAPCVKPIAVITGREDEHGEELTAALVTEHLEYSLPYRAVFSQAMRPETASRLIDSLAVLLVRMHLLNFFWGDVSLSNTLFRRDADSFSGYLVDAETGELQPELSEQRRLYDVEIARVNIIGELMDLQAGGLMEPEVDTIAVGNHIVEKYELLWRELTAEEAVDPAEPWRVQQRIERLNSLGFDVGELKIAGDEHSLRIRPRVVDAGHHNRALMRLTGMDLEERQARRILNLIASYAAMRSVEVDPQVAHNWLAEIYEPVLALLPTDASQKLSPAQTFHEIVEHQWYLSEAAGAEVPLMDAARHYIDTIMPQRRNEAVLLDDDDAETEADPS